MTILYCDVSSLKEVRTCAHANILLLSLVSLVLMTRYDSSSLQSSLAVVRADKIIWTVIDYQTACVIVVYIPVEFYRVSTGEIPDHNHRNNYYWPVSSHILYHLSETNLTFRTFSVPSICYARCVSHRKGHWVRKY